MKYLLDQRVLVGVVVDGDRHLIGALEWHRKRDVLVPEPVIVYVAHRVTESRSSRARDRWDLLLPALPRMPWTAEVTAKLLALEPADGMTVLDTIVVAHALAGGLEVVTTDLDLFERIPELRVTLCV